jgi:hypothetical protein
MALGSIGNVEKRRQRGRPAVNATPITVRLHPEQLHILDSWRTRQKDNPGRPEAIRRLLDQALKRR